MQRSKQRYLHQFAFRSDRTTALLRRGIMLQLAINQNLWGLLAAAPLLHIVYKVNKPIE